jgi:hypothetical protein
MDSVRRCYDLLSSVKSCEIFKVKRDRKYTSLTQICDTATGLILSYVSDSNQLTFILYINSTARLHHTHVTSLTTCHLCLWIDVSVRWISDFLYLHAAIKMNWCHASTNLIVLNQYRSKRQQTGTCLSLSVLPNRTWPADRIELWVHMTWRGIEAGQDWVANC